MRVAPTAVRPGEAAAATVHVTARAGYHVTPEYPMSFRPGKESTVTFKSARLALTPATTTACQAEPSYTCALAVELPFTAPAQGEAVLAGTLHFSVCSAERCLIEKVPLLVRVGGALIGSPRATGGG